VCARSSLKWTKSGTREFNALMKFWESEYAMLQTQRIQLLEHPANVMLVVVVPMATDARMQILLEGSTTPIQLTS
jgi:hypothetical protein